MSRVLTKFVPYTAQVNSSTSVQILPANTSAKYREIANPLSVGLWLGFGQVAVIGQGGYVPPGSVIEIDGDNLWQKAIHGIASSGAGGVVGGMDLQ